PTSCYLSLLPRPPRSPLFPYTTLFRSERDEPDVRMRDEPLAHGNPVARHDLQHARRDHLLRELNEPQQRERRLLRGLQDLHVAQDRKSTRLNSSHSQISYAVFCLKKKK